MDGSINKNRRSCFVNDKCVDDSSLAHHFFMEIVEKYKVYILVAASAIHDKADCIKTYHFHAKNHVANGFLGDRQTVLEISDYIPKQTSFFIFLVRSHYTTLNFDLKIMQIRCCIKRRYSHMIVYKYLLGKAIVWHLS